MSFSTGTAWDLRHPDPIIVPVAGRRSDLVVSFPRPSLAACSVIIAPHFGYDHSLQCRCRM
ncbi:MAG: hypothetical protein ACLRWP_01775 [Bilophila wadsworthia]